MNISNELRNEKMTNDFNEMINNKLEELIEEKIKDKINDCNKKIEELKISNEVHDKNLQGNMVLSNKSINDLEKKIHDKNFKDSVSKELQDIISNEVIHVKLQEFVDKKFNSKEISKKMKEFVYKALQDNINKKVEGLSTSNEMINNKLEELIDKKFCSNKVINNKLKELVDKKLQNNVDKKLEVINIPIEMIDDNIKIVKNKKNKEININEKLKEDVIYMFN